LEGISIVSLDTSAFVILLVSYSKACPAYFLTTIEQLVLTYNQVSIGHVPRIS